MVESHAEKLSNYQHGGIDVRHIHSSDLKAALRAGWQDFLAKPSHIFFLGLIYPILGFIFARLTSNMNLIPLIYPLLTGFALIGPLAAVGLYELSRRKELGQELHWRYAFSITKSPAFGSILALGGILLVVFFFWMVTAYVIYRWTLGTLSPDSLRELLNLTVTTREGWTLIVLGNFVGFIFALFTLTISVVSFPMLLDRHCSVRRAMQTSYKAVRQNFPVMMLWGVTITFGLFLGSLPLLVGLAVVLPVFGHASWHLYRRLVP
ncbi:MAG: DUF2189 domain-containing protein [Sphingomonadales bacterium]|jgi:uncharacterized membrane protein